MTLHSLERSLSQAEFDLFARISGDNNPIHVDTDFSSRTRFGRTVSHGMLLYTILWGLVQKHYPGAKQIRQDLMFPNPAYADESLRFEIAEAAVSGSERNLSARVSRASDGALVLEGQTTITLS